MFHRSKNIVVYVDSSQSHEATEFYRRAFGMELQEQDPVMATLKGPNFMLYVEQGDPAGLHLQEWVPPAGVDAEKHLLDLGCKLIEVNGSTHSTDGFYIEDPYGLRYHVYTSEPEMD